MSVAEVHRRVAGGRAGAELRGGVHGARAVRAAAGGRRALGARLAAPRAAPARRPRAPRAPHTPARYPPPRTIHSDSTGLALIDNNVAVHISRSRSHGTAGPLRAGAPRAGAPRAGVPGAGRAR